MKNNYSILVIYESISYYHRQNYLFYENKSVSKFII